MMIKSRGRSGLMCCALVCASACAEEEFPLPPIVWEGETVRVRMDDETIPVCGGTFEALDLHANLVREALLLEGRDKIIDFAMGTRDFVEDRCNDPIGGCTMPTTGYVFASPPLFQHELVHAVRILDPKIKLLSPAIEEGLATLFGADLGGSGTIELGALEILEKDRVLGAPDYYRAGQVMAILLERHGLEAFRRFDLLVRTRGEDVAFLEVFGETKDVFAQAAEATPQCEATKWWRPLLECSGEAELPDPETGKLVLLGNVSCGEPNIIGPNTRGEMWTFRHFLLTERTSELTDEFDIPEDATLEIVGCNLGCPDRFVYSGGLWDLGSVLDGVPSLDPGEYFLRISRPLSEEDGQFRIAL